MKLHRLEIEGFGPFLRRQVIDFDEYDADGLFLISGKTGAGKSSLLDAVCFALYATVPRYSSAGGKRVRSDHALPDDVSEVSLTFSTGNETYRVTRSPEYERPKQRGGGMTTQAATVQLDRRDGEQWIGIASRAVDAGNQLAEILQLNKDQFLQVILLAQNRFAKFLLADSKERQTLLRTLFGTRRFEDYQKQLIERRKLSEQTMAAARARLLDRLGDAEKLVDAHGWGETHEDLIGTVPGDDAAPLAADDAHGAGAGLGGETGAAAGTAVGAGGTAAGAGMGHSADEADTDTPLDATLLPVADRLERLHVARDRGAYRVEATTNALAHADANRVASAAAAANARAQRDHQNRRDLTRAQLARLEERAPEILQDRAELAAAREAQTVASAIAAHDRDIAAAAQAAADQAGAKERWTTYATDPATAPTAAYLRERADECTAAQGALAAAAAAEADLTQHEDAEIATRAARVEAETAVATLRDEAQRIPAELAVCERALMALQARADRIEELTSRRSTLDIQLGAAQQLEGHERDRDRAIEAAYQANAAARAGVDKLDALYKRKLAGAASELAATLTDGVACPVCGSDDHPHPAPVLVDPVTDTELAAVTAERDALQRAATAASEAEQAAATALSHVIAAAGGQSLEQLTAAQQKLAAEIADAETAQAEHATTQRTRDELLAREKSMSAAIDEAMKASAEALAAQAAAQEQARAARESVAAARGEYATVADRISAIAAERDAAQAYAAALENVAVAETAVRRSRAALERALATTTFATAVQAQDAARSPEEMAALDARIAEHDSALRAAKATLMELELEVLPDDAIDVDAAEAAAEAAQQEWARIGSELTALQSAVAALAERTTAAEDEQQRQATALTAHETIERLADTVSGHEPNTKRMSLETFILAAELEEIVAAANVRLGDMSSGRYRLQHSDERVGNAAAGLGIDIFDSFTSKARPAHSLSGGETFLASLSLALGLAEVVTNRAGGVRLDTLFIDEGFGSLDPDTLAIAMQTLDELRSGGRTVGIISHVEAMKEQIPAQLRVRVASDGSSDIITR